MSYLLAPSYAFYYLLLAMLASFVFSYLIIRSLDI
jgi:hypothetical protein